jgi:DNA-binding phage protein
LVNATIGFEQLAIETSKPSKSLHRMLTKNGNPSMDNIASIYNAIRKNLRLKISAQAKRKAI